MATAEANYMSKATLKEEYGFTDSMIKKLMPPCELTKPNPYYKSASPMQLWSADTVDKIVNSAEYKTALEKASKRKSSAQKALKTKAENLKSKIYAEAESLEVEQIPFAQAVEQALRSKVAHYSFYRDDDYGDDFGVYSADEQTKHRWTVNYIRHHLTNYDYVCGLLSKKVGKDEAYLILSGVIYKKIAEAYPQLENECKSQCGCKTGTEW